MPLAPNDARLTGLRVLEAATGSAAGVVAAGAPVDVVLSVEAGAAIFGVGARFAAGVQIDGAAAEMTTVVRGCLGGREWPTPLAELRLVIPASATAALADRLLAVAAFLRVNASPPFIVSVMRGPDLFVAPASLQSPDSAAALVARQNDGRVAPTDARPATPAPGGPPRHP
jgi:hypothetical protein